MVQASPSTSRLTAKAVCLAPSCPSTEATATPQVISELPHCRTPIRSALLIIGGLNKSTSSNAIRSGVLFVLMLRSQTLFLSCFFLLQKQKKQLDYLFEVFFWGGLFVCLFVCLFLIRLFDSMASTSSKSRALMLR